MSWPEIRERYPHQWLLLEATEAHSSGGQRILESLTLLETCPDGLSAMRRYGEIHGQDPHRELYALHTIERPWRSKKSTGLESGRPLENPVGG
jgi:hypothetical protein